MHLYYRLALCYFLVASLLLLSALRVAVVLSEEEYLSAANAQNVYRLSASRQRKTIFDTNGKRLSNNKTSIVTAVFPTDEALSLMKERLTADKYEELLSKIGNLPVCISTDMAIEGEGVINTTVYKTDSVLSEHLIGYVDSEGHGVCGLELAFDSALYTESRVNFCFARDSLGNIIKSFPVTVEREENLENEGIKVTIDSDIQAAVNIIADKLRSGAIIVSEVGNGKIRAAASRPSFDITRVKEYLNDQTSPLINRAFCSYNVGSVFKPAVAAAALENGISDFEYTCTGGSEIAGKFFSCHDKNGHGTIDMKRALALSCNSYFYALAERVGGGAIYEIAEGLGFGQKHSFAPSLASEKESFPSASLLIKSPQVLANTSIGQGDTMLTPVSLLSLYEAIAGRGVYHRPTLFEGFLENGVVTGADTISPTRVMSEETAAFLKDALCGVITDGTGVLAAPKFTTAAGKTATAQTGWIKDGKAVDHSWFCGFFPADEPRYVAVIISENTSGGGTAPAPLFSELADIIYTIKLS